MFLPLFHHNDQKGSRAYAIYMSPASAGEAVGADTKGFASAWGGGAAWSSGAAAGCGTEEASSLET
jgi:hypothetical protein